MTSSRFDLGSTSKTLDLSLLRFNEWSGSENLDSMCLLKVLFKLNLVPCRESRYTTKIILGKLIACNILYK